jgi:ligand-binding sensor domain-containing protein
MLKTGKKFIAVIFLLSGLQSYAQLPVITTYSVANSPLPENSIRCISIDGQGRKWIGTDYGLAIFDDINWTIYYPFVSGLPAMSVRAIVFDNLQNAWIGTLGGGVVKFDGINWTVYDDSNSPLTDNFIRSLAFDSAGALWIGNQDGLAKFDGNNWIIYSSSNSIIQNTIASIHPLSNQRILAGSVNGGLFLLRQDTIKANYTIANGSGIPDNTLLAFAEDSLGNVWIATPANGIVVYRNVGGWFWYYMGNSGIASNSLNDLTFSEDQAELWLATSDAGVIKKTGVTYTTFSMATSPIPDNNIQCLTIDSNHVLWLGSASQGLIRFDVSTAIENNMQTSNIQIFPNPVTDYCLLHSDKIPYLLMVYDNNGRLLDSKQVTQHDYYYTLPVQQSEAILFKMLRHGRVIATQKIMKQR